MQEVIKALNRLVSDKVIPSYAIGGAVGAAFYIEATQTEDIAAFVVLPSTSSGLVVLTPIYEALAAMGGILEGEYVRFGDWPLQVLTDANPLLVEAIREAMTVEYDGVPTRVFRAEHLCAVALQTGRTKDYLRVTLFLEQGGVDQSSLRQILDRHGLSARLARVTGAEGI